MIRDDSSTLSSLHTLFLLLLHQLHLRSSGIRSWRLGTFVLKQGFPGGARNRRTHLQKQQTKEMWVRSLSWEDPLEEGMAQCLLGPISATHPDCLSEQLTHTTYASAEQKITRYIKILTGFNETIRANNPERKVLHKRNFPSSVSCVCIFNNSYSYIVLIK